MTGVCVEPFHAVGPALTVSIKTQQAGQVGSVCVESGLRLERCYTQQRSGPG